MIGGFFRIDNIVYQKIANTVIHLILGERKLFEFKYFSFFFFFLLELDLNLNLNLLIIDQHQFKVIMVGKLMVLKFQY